jgi:hypothetical protein
MFLQRMSNEARNEALEDRTPAQGRRVTSNGAWLRSLKPDTGVVLIGGNSVPHFRARAAQAELRADLLPSYWSLAAVVASSSELFTVPFDRHPEQATIPESNGIQAVPIEAFDDVTLYPNFGYLRFACDPPRLLAAIGRLQRLRATHRYPDALWEWLGYLWGAQEATNPIRRGSGTACARFVNQVFADCNIDLLPGVASGGACPELIWTSALYWSSTFAPESEAGADDEAAGKSPAVTGAYRLLQPAAAVRGQRDTWVARTIVPSKQQRSALDESLARARAPRGKRAR